ncbi:MAG: Glutamate/gamma-aminobutyrate antiporter [Chlamydiae bacterium]|nr:Glutamate/gamma-aminobutyrate antiporter [Chlamydiota bacterium]
MQKKPKKVLSVFLLAMMNVAIVLSLRGLPIMAKEGTSLIFYLLFSLFIFLIPSALVSAELATGWPEEGGVFRWVEEAFGTRAGFTAIWLQWIQNVIWYPIVLAFAAAALAYLFVSPELAENPLYNILVILAIYWGATLVNAKGLKASGILTSLGVVAGTILPGLFIIFLGFFWWLGGEPLAFLDESHKVVPSLSDFSSISFLAGIILLFAGIEVTAVHAKEVRDPRRGYPKAILLSVLIIFVLFFFGALSVGAVLPQESISLTAGIMQALQLMLERFHMSWLLPVMGFLVAFGTIGGVAAWIVGPSKGFFATAKQGLIPPYLSHSNKKGVPTHILFVQGLVVTALSLLYLVTPTISSAFFLLTALGVMLYLVMYILLFAAGIALRYKHPGVRRDYRIPGGHLGIWIVSGVGIMGALFAIVIGFFPPRQLEWGSKPLYVWFLVIGLLLGLILPQLILKARKPHWKRRVNQKNG